MYFLCTLEVITFIMRPIARGPNFIYYKTREGARELSTSALAILFRVKRHFKLGRTLCRDTGRNFPFYRVCGPAEITSLVSNQILEASRAPASAAEYKFQWFGSGHLIFNSVGSKHPLLPCITANNAPADRSAPTMNPIPVYTAMTRRNCPTKLRFRY